MTMTSDRPKLGGIFGGTPDRTADLAGILGSPAEVPPTADAAEAVEDDAPDTTAGERPLDAGPEPIAAKRATRPVRPTRSAPTRSDQPRAAVAAKDATAGNKVVPVVLDASILQDLREFAARTEQTQGSVALRAIEAHADELASHWSTPASDPGRPGRLFGTHTSLRRRTEPGVQTQLRIAAPDAETLDELAVQWDAPSRSALVNEALRRYVRSSTTTP
jgi:hypothetical protein